jgi:hypothetical protein
MLAPVWEAIKSRVAHLDLRDTNREEQLRWDFFKYTSPGGSLRGSDRDPGYFAVRSTMDGDTINELRKCGVALEWLAVHLSNILETLLEGVGKDYLVILRHNPLQSAKVFCTDAGSTPPLQSGGRYRGSQPTLALVVVAPHPELGASAHVVTIKVPASVSGRHAWYDPRTEDGSIEGVPDTLVKYRLTLLGYPSQEDSPACPWPDAWVHALLMQAESSVERSP